MAVPTFRGYTQSNVYQASSKTMGYGVDAGTSILFAIYSGSGNSYPAGFVDLCTFNGVSMTQVAAVSNNEAYTEIFYLVNPPVGSYNVVFTFRYLSGGNPYSNSNTGNCIVTHFGNCLSTASPIGNNGTGANSATLTIQKAGNVTLEASTSYNGIPSPQSGQTTIWAEGLNNRYSCVAYKTQPASGSVTDSFSNPDYRQTTSIIEMKRIPMKQKQLIIT